MCNDSRYNSAHPSTESLTFQNEISKPKPKKKKKKRAENDSQNSLRNRNANWNMVKIKNSIKWASSCENGSYHKCRQQRLRRENKRKLPAESHISRPFEWLLMRVWRITIWMMLRSLFSRVGSNSVMILSFQTDRPWQTNSVDPDQTASEQSGQHCLSFHLHQLDALL